jgi:hypothetical protein
MGRHEAQRPIWPNCLAYITMAPSAQTLAALSFPCHRPTPLIPAIRCPCSVAAALSSPVIPPTLAGLYPCSYVVVRSSSIVSSSPSPEIPAHGGIAGRDAAGGAPQQPPLLPR